jgi:protein SCO1/2
VTDGAPLQSNLKRVRVMLWALVALAALVVAVVTLWPRQPAPQHSFGGPFILTAADGRPFSSEKLAGKPYAIYFGFTRCGDVCPTTLSRLVRLRKAAGDEKALRIVFVTIDPEHDGPKEVGQYATLFNAAIIGLTGSPARIAEVKKQYGIHAEPQAHAAMGKEVMHSAAVLLFDRKGQFVTTITPDEPDASALDKIKRLVA